MSSNPVSYSKTPGKSLTFGFLGYKMRINTHLTELLGPWEINICQSPRTLPGLGRHSLKVIPAFIINILSGLRVPVDSSGPTGREHVWEQLFLRCSGKQELSGHSERTGPAVPISWNLMIWEPLPGCNKNLTGENFPSNPKGYLVVSLDGSARTLHTGRTSKINDFSVWNWALKLTWGKMPVCLCVPRVGFNFSVSFLYLVF